MGDKYLSVCLPVCLPVCLSVSLSLLSLSAPCCSYVLDGKPTYTIVHIGEERCRNSSRAAPLGLASLPPQHSSSLLEVSATLTSTGDIAYYTVARGPQLQSWYPRVWGPTIWDPTVSSHRFRSWMHSHLPLGSHSLGSHRLGLPKFGAR